MKTETRTFSMNATRILFPMALAGFLSAIASANQPIILDQTAADSLRIQTVDALHSDFSETLFAIGHIQPIPARKSVLSSRIPGRVVTIEAYEGDEVLANQALVEIESLQPGNPPPRIRLEAPLPGIVMRSHTHIGKPVVPDNELLEIIDLREVYAVARLPEDQAGKTPIGTRATIRVAAAPGRDFEGELVRFGTEANTESGTIDAHFILENPDNTLRPNMRAEFSIEISSKSNALSVPKVSIQGDGISEFLFIEYFDLPNAFQKVPVLTGARNETRVEIIRGIFPGDKVVTNGSYALMFAGNGSISLKEALDAAHGHEHNEDGSEMTPEQRREKEKAQSPNGGSGHDQSPTILFLSILSGLLFVLLILSLAIRRNA